MDITEAKHMAYKAIRLIMGQNAPEIHFYDEQTLEKPYGWIFFYTSKDFFNSGNPLDGIVGTGPIIVNKISRTTEVLGSAMEYTYYVYEYEKRLGLNF